MFASMDIEEMVMIGERWVSNDKVGTSAFSDSNESNLKRSD